ncbi:MAG: hypothetical protein ABW135_04160 [Thermoleophilaceae bacterium]|jgi:hypothetical protein
MQSAANTTTSGLLGLAPSLPRTERLRLTLSALGTAALTLLGLHHH